MATASFIRNTTEPLILTGEELVATAAANGFASTALDADAVGVGFADAYGNVSIWYGTSWQEMVHDFSDILKAVQQRADEAGE